jgi:hypothetical protein
MKAALATALLLGCASSNEPVVVDLRDATHAFDVDGERELRIVGTGMAEAWIDDGTFADEMADTWLVPQPIAGERTLTVRADGEVTVQVWARGDEPPAATRARSVTWFDAALLDDGSTLSFARVMAAISDDGHGGVLLDRWFRAFTAGPGAGRAAFAQFLVEVEGAQGADPRAWNLAELPFKVTGVHNRQDLARGEDCGELRVSIASTHPTFTPVHLLFLFRQVPEADDVTPDGTIHCRGTARRWAALAGLDAASFTAAARALLDRTLTRDRFEMTESVELTISPWQWRQWTPDGAGGLANPALFQTIVVARVNTPGATRDAFLAAVDENREAIASRTWLVPGAFRSAVAEVQPNAKATLPATGDVALDRALGLIGCPRCHTDDADFIQTSVDRTPSPFYDRELDARAARLDALARGGWPGSAPFGPLQPTP